MINVESITKSTSSLPASLDTPSEEPNLSFSQLLKGIKNLSSSVALAFDSDEINTKIVLKDTNSKESAPKENLLSLLKNIELNETLPSEIKSFTPKELKVLVQTAKDSLKDKIIQSDGYIKSSVKDLPKSLKGLVDLAKKFDVDLSKISLEVVKSTKAEVKQSIPLKQSVPKITSIPVNNIVKEKPILKEQEIKPLEAMLKSTNKQVKRRTKNGLSRLLGLGSCLCSVLGSVMNRYSNSHCMPNPTT